MVTKKEIEKIIERIDLALLSYGIKLTTDEILFLALESFENETARIIEKWNTGKSNQSKN